MKRILFLLIIILLLSAGCTSNDINSSKENINNSSTDIHKDDKNIIDNNQKYSFGPMADLSKISNDTKQQLQELLNELGDVESDQITFEIIDAGFQEDGGLILDLFIRNGYSYAITNIDCDIKIIKQDKIIASANFQLIEREFGVLPSNTSRPWSIMFFPEDILIENAELKDCTIKAENIQFENVGES